MESDKREMDYEITPEEVKAKLDAGAQFTLLDVREAWEYSCFCLLPLRVAQAWRIFIPMAARGTSRF